MRLFKEITSGSYISFDRDFDREHADWIVVPCSLTRDSDCLEESNHSAVIERLGGESESLVVVEHSHWACGWIRFIIAHPSRFSEVEDIAEKLDVHPVLNEDDFSEREQAEADRVWVDCYSAAERIAYIREHASQFEFHDMRDMIGCVRGKYFAGYASELIS